jgi:ribosomal protein L1
MKSFKKISTQTFFNFTKANYFDVSRGANKLTDQKLKSIVENESKTFADWLTQKALQGKGISFQFSDLSENLRSTLNSVPGVIDNRMENKEINWKLLKNRPTRIFNELLDTHGSIDHTSIQNIVQNYSKEFTLKKIYESPMDAINAVKFFDSQPNIITMQIILNLDYSRSDHKIPPSVIKLPFESTILNDISVITSETNNELAVACGAKSVMTAARLASALEEKTFFQKKVLVTEDQYEDLISYCKDGLKELGVQIPTRENGNVISNEDLKTVMIFLTTNHVHLKIMERKSQYVKGTEYYNKIIQIDLGDTTMEADHLLKNIDYVLKSISHKQPESIQGRYFLTAVLIVNNMVFNIQPQTLDPKLEKYKWAAGLLN